MGNETLDIAIKNNFLDSIILKIAEFDKAVQNLKCNFQDTEEKKRKVDLLRMI